MDINVFHRYSLIREKLLCITYNAIGIKLTDTLQACDRCTSSTVKSRVVSKNTYTRVSQPLERIFVETAGPFSKRLVGNWYWIGVVEYYSHYSWSLFTKTKSQLLKKWNIYSKRWRHVVLQSNTYVVTTQGNTNQNCRMCAKNNILRGIIQHRTHPSWTAS